MPPGTPRRVHPLIAAAIGLVVLVVLVVAFIVSIPLVIAGVVVFTLYRGFRAVFASKPRGQVVDEGRRNVRVIGNGARPE